ncbi:MAG: thiolase domain-containing protein [Acidobacteriota bacterium]
MRDVAIIGIGMTDFGELWHDSLRDLFVKAALEAMDDAGVDHIDGLVAGCMSPGLFSGQEHIGSLLADYLGQAPVPGVRVESACASGGMALRTGIAYVASGMHDIVLCGGVEKMTDVSGAQATYALATAADQEMEAFHGATFPGLYALIATAHMHQYGTKREDLAQVAVKNHDNGMLNPHAQYRMKITVDQVINSVKVADPLNILDCSPITDGAAAVVIVPLEMAKKLKKKPIVKVAASAHATDTIALHQRDDLTWLKSTAEAAASAYKQAGVKPSDIDFAEVHDCFTIAEICVLEALGVVKKGQGGKATRDGLTARDGKFPVNVSGGLKSKGHPVGATGIAQIHEIVTQLRGEAGKRQLKGVKRGLAQNMGGSGGSAVVHILEVL